MSARLGSQCRAVSGQYYVGFPSRVPAGYQLVYSGARWRYKVVTQLKHPSSDLLVFPVLGSILNHTIHLSSGHTLSQTRQLQIIGKSHLNYHRNQSQKQNYLPPLMDSTRPKKLWIRMGPN